MRYGYLAALAVLPLFGCGNSGSGGVSPPQVVVTPTPAPSPAPTPTPPPPPTPDPPPTALKQFIVAHYAQPNPHNQMPVATPPAITTSTTAPADLTEIYRYAEDAAQITYAGGGDTRFAGAMRFFPVATVGVDGGNTGNGEDAVSWRVGATITAQKISIRLLGSTSPFRIIVDGQYISFEGTSTQTDAGLNFITLDFGSRSAREIWVEGQYAQAFEGFAIAPGDTIEAIDSPHRIIFAGDSYTAGAAGVIAGDLFARVAADTFGIDDAWLSGVGATGYLADSNGGKLKLGDRLTDINDTGPWDIIVIAMGANDIEYPPAETGAAAKAVFENILANNPDAVLFVLGPIDSMAPNDAGADYVATTTAIRDAAIELGIRFIDMQGVAFSKADPVHPDVDGHMTLGNYVAEQMRLAFD